MSVCRIRPTAMLKLGIERRYRVVGSKRYLGEWDKPGRPRVPGLAGTGPMLQAATMLLTGIAIAVLSALVTVRLSLRRFRSERYWDRRVQAYERLIAALHDCKALAEHHLETIYSRTELTKAEDEYLRNRFKATHNEIARAIDMGSFLVSDESLERLRRYHKSKNEGTATPNGYEDLERDWEAVNCCLADLIRLARKDLQARDLSNQHSDEP